MLTFHSQIAVVGNVALYWAFDEVGEWHVVEVEIPY